VSRHYLPALVMAGGPPVADAGVALLDDRATRDGKAVGYVCRQYLCAEPTADAARLGSLLEEAAQTAR
jgi:uncharacterized protein YyaL (SSP411 family)